MRRRINFVAFVLALAVLASLFACGKTSVPTSTPDSETPPQYDKDKYQIAVLLCDAAMRSASNQSVWAGANKFAQESGLRIKWFSVNRNEEAEAEIDTIASEGFTVVICANGDINEALAVKAAQYPDITFALIDAIPAEETLQNLTAVTIRAEEATFIAGYIAAAQTDTGSVGFLGGTENSPGFQLEAGFRAGAEYAAAERGEPITVHAEYVGNAYNRDGGYDLMDRMRLSGVGVVFVATSGDTAGGALYAANLLGQKCITMGDIAYMAPNHAIASVYKKMDQVAYLALRGICDGTVKSEAVYYGISDGLAGLVKSSNLAEKLGEEFAARVDSIAEKLVKGEIKVSNKLVR
ncbi:MAG: BMP family ABC transporter substrate-binding protein [Oscillospiraceae bacterium]|jgi:basic membrane protein A|nr:BMP family ABC transporter substrate-binding protein [Oscillospiraceae bacterium]